MLYKAAKKSKKGLMVIFTYSFTSRAINKNNQNYVDEE